MCVCVITGMTEGLSSTDIGLRIMSGMCKASYEWGCEASYEWG